MIGNDDDRAGMQMNNLASIRPTTNRLFRRFAENGTTVGATDVPVTAP